MAQAFGIVSEVYTDTEFLGDHPPITEAGTLGAGTLSSGTVVGTITATGKYVQLAPAASDGSETASAILLGDLDASGGDENGVFVVHGEALDASLVWPDGITVGEKATAKAQLKAAGIYVK